MVYVDDMRAPFGRMIMCHMVADSPEELLAMAARIGVQAKWIQHAGTPKEHFDIALTARAKAVKAGAVEIRWRQCSLMCWRRRVEGVLGLPGEAERWMNSYSARKAAA